MEEEKRAKRRKKSDGTHSEKRKKVLQILSNAELEEAAAVNVLKKSHGLLDWLSV